MAHKRWKDEPWATRPEVLLNDLEKLYRQAIKLGKVETVAKTTAKKAMAFRQWSGAVPMARVIQAVKDLEMIYVPNGCGPGPAFLFPVRDMTGEVRRAHLRMVDESVYGFRYISLMNPEKFIGPGWSGNDEDTLEAIIQTGEVTLVEGPFDLVALRIAEPRLPSLCSLSKRMSDDHWDYLKILGVERLYPMFDVEKSRQGEAAMDRMAATHREFQVMPLRCPAKDPSDALKHPAKFEALRRTLTEALPAAFAATFTLDEDE